MKLNEYQQQAVTTAIYPDDMKILYPALGLGEAGEVQNKIKKIYRDSGGEISATDRLGICAEMGDLLWYIAVLARDLELSLDDVASINLATLKSRKERGVLGGSGDKR